MADAAGAKNGKGADIVTFGISPQEAAIIRRKAADHGQTVAAMMRTSLLHVRLRPPARPAGGRPLIRGSGQDRFQHQPDRLPLNAGRPPSGSRARIELALRDLSNSALPAFRPRQGTPPGRQTAEG